MKDKDLAVVKEEMRTLCNERAKKVITARWQCVSELRDAQRI